MTLLMEAPRLSRVDGETAQRVKSRRMALGMSVKKLAESAGIDRGTLTALESADPRTRESTVGAVEAALSRLEHEMGMDLPPLTEADLVEFRVSGNFGVDVVVKGPLRDAEQLEASVARLVERMQRERRELDRD